MKIVRLTAENIKRLRAVQITPDGNTVVIAGKNGAGKTSVLDSIWYALGGGTATKDTARPIRDGEQQASVVLDLGELTVTRTWKGEKTTLRVESADGAQYRSPQQLLDRLVGKLSFDPLAFANLPERDQLATLLDLVELPFDPDELDQQRRTLYDERTVVGREGKTLTGQLAGMPEPPTGLPADEVSTADVLTEYRRAQEQQSRNDALRREAQEAHTDHKRIQEHVHALRDELRQAEADENSLRNRSAALAAQANEIEDPDLGQYEQKLAGVEEKNRQIRAARQRADVTERVAAKRAQYEDLTKRIHDLDERKAQAIRDAKMPIDGLAFDDTGVTYRGVPFKQCSSAEQLRVSLAMAMSLNPSIRVIRITDGSLLDSDNMRLIEEMAADRDFQVWIERVDETGAVGIHIEDGAVAGSHAEDGG